MIKYIFSPESVEVCKPKIFQVSRGSEVIIDHFHFMENEISRIEVKKIEKYQDTIFINLYSGNRRIGHVVAKEPYVLEIDTIGNLQRYYDIRLATELDKDNL